MVLTLADRLARLAQAFNEARLDVPDGLFDRACRFRLNGVAYEETMGRPLSDPIVRLVARGPAAYRFLAQALRYALPDARVAIDELDAGSVRGGEGLPVLASTTASLEGGLRGTGTPFRAQVAVALLVGSTGSVQECAVLMDEPDLAAIVEARRR